MEHAFYAHRDNSLYVGEMDGYTVFRVNNYILFRKYVRGGTEDVYCHSVQAMADFSARIGDLPVVLRTYNALKYFGLLPFDCAACREEEHKEDE